MRASDLLFAFEDAFHVDRQSAAGAEIGFDCFDMRKELAFVVTGASAVKVRVQYGWIEGRSSPFAHGLPGQNIIVPVD